MRDKPQGPPVPAVPVGTSLEPQPAPGPSEDHQHQLGAGRWEPKPEVAGVPPAGSSGFPLGDPPPSLPDVRQWTTGSARLEASPQGVQETTSFFGRRDQGAFLQLGSGQLEFILALPRRLHCLVSSQSVGEYLGGYVRGQELMTTQPGLQEVPQGRGGQAPAPLGLETMGSLFRFTDARAWGSQTISRGRSPGACA